MLLITRRTGEAIVINGSIEVKVLDVKGGRVKLGFEYPEGSTVYRQELFDKIRAENKVAALAGAALEADTQQFSIMVQNLLPTGRSRTDAPDGDAQKGRQEGSKHEHRNPNHSRSDNGHSKR